MRPRPRRAPALALLALAAGCGTRADPTPRVKSAGPRDVRAVSVGYSSCAIDGEGALWCWGGMAAIDAPLRVAALTPVPLPEELR